jgi:hypothetical protein
MKVGLGSGCSDFNRPTHPQFEMHPAFHARSPMLAAVLYCALTENAPHEFGAAG